MLKVGSTSVIYKFNTSGREIFGSQSFSVPDAEGFYFDNWDTL